MMEHDKSQSQLCDLFPPGNAVTNGLLARCIRFMNLQERVRTAVTSRHLFDVCSSVASWSCDGVLESVHSSAKKMTEGRAFSFSFNGPALRCQPNKLNAIKSNKLFKHVRCIELLWSDGSKLSEFWDSMNGWSELEHVFFTNASGFFSTDSLYGPLNPGTDVLPNTLKSFSFVVSGSEKAAFNLVNLLPSSLHTLQVLFVNCNGDAQLPPIFTQALQNLTRLERLVLHRVSYAGLFYPESTLNDVDFRSSKSPALRIHSDLRLKIVPIGPIVPEQLLSQLNAVSHLHIAECRAFFLELQGLDWSSFLPHLTSLHLDRIHVEPSSKGESRSKEGHTLPEVVGLRIRTLVIGSIPFEKRRDESKDTSHALFFSESGLTNVTGLTIKTEYQDSPYLLDAMVNLTHLSFKQSSFLGCSKLRKLQSLQMCGWPSTYLRLHPSDRPLKRTDFKALIHGTRDSGKDEEVDPPMTSLADVFPSLTELVVASGKAVKSEKCCYSARESLLTVPHLKSIKWEAEPILHPNQIESFYSLDAIADRETRRLQQMIDDKHHIKSYLTLATSSSTQSDSTICQSTCTIARHFNLFSLSLSFQSLTPVEVARASSVSKHWRSAALSPLVLRHHIRVVMHQLQGAQVHGPQIRITSVLPMVQAVHSEVFRNLRILTLGMAQAEQAAASFRMARESQFAHVYLKLFNYVPLFTSLHTLALNWDYTFSISKPTLTDIESIRRVISSRALTHLKVLRIMASPWIIRLMIQFLPKLKSLEVVELRYSHHGSIHSDDIEDSADFAEPLLQLPQLKHLYVCNYNMNSENDMLEELRRFCCGVSSSFEEVMWRVPLDQTALISITKNHRENSSYVFPCLKSIHISFLVSSLNALADASYAMPDLTDVSISDVTQAHESCEAARPLPPALASRLRSIKVALNLLPSYAEAIVKSLIASNLMQLQCVHMFFSDRDSLLHSLDDAFVQFIENCKNLTELNCSGFSLPHTFWSRVLPRLHVVHCNESIQKLIYLCQELRELHGEKSQVHQLRSKLLQLPHFQIVVYRLAGNSQLFVETRAEIARILAQQQESLKRMQKRNEEIQTKRLQEGSDSEAQHEEGSARNRARHPPTIDDPESDEILAQIIASLANP